MELSLLRSVQRSVTHLRIEEGPALPFDVSRSVEVGVEMEITREADELRSSWTKCIFRKTLRTLFRRVIRLFLLGDDPHADFKCFIAELIPDHREGEAIRTMVQLLPSRCSLLFA